MNTSFKDYRAAMLRRNPGIVVMRRVELTFGQFLDLQQEAFEAGVVHHAAFERALRQAEAEELKAANGELAAKDAIC